MALLRLQDKVPSIYVEQSRDFQLLCRLYDVLLNGVKYDTDGVRRIANTHDCKSNILQLLQTKLGFFSNYNFTDDMLRTILSAFPILVKRKGTKTAIEEAVYVYLKTLGLETTIKVDIIENAPTASQQVLYGSRVTDHSVVIGIDSLAQEIKPLKEILKYIVPFGYNIFFYFFVGEEQEDIIEYSSEAKLVLISDSINSALMGSVPVTETTYTRMEGDPQRQEFPYTTYWEKPEEGQEATDTSYQYKSEAMKNLISTINMMETISTDTITTDEKTGEIKGSKSKDVLTEDTLEEV